MLDFIKCPRKTPPTFDMITQETSSSENLTIGFQLLDFKTNKKIFEVLIIFSKYWSSAITFENENILYIISKINQKHIS